MYSREEGHILLKLKNPLKTKKQKDLAFVICMLAIPVAHFFVFWLFVNLRSILYAFQQETGGQIVYTLNNFKNIIRDVSSGEGNIISESVFNSFKFLFLSVFVSTPICVFFSFVLYKKIPGHGVFRVIFFLPAIISQVILSTIFTYFINPGGPLNAILGIFGIAEDSIPQWLGDPKYALLTVMVFTIWSGIGAGMVVYSGTIARIPGDIMEYDKLEGVGIFREFFQIVIPLIWPTLSTMLVLTLAGMAALGGQVMLLTEGKFGTYTIGYFIFRSMKYSSSYYYPSALGLMTTAILFPIVMLVKNIFNRFWADVQY